MFPTFTPSSLGLAFRQNSDLLSSDAPSKAVAERRTDQRVVLNGPSAAVRRSHVSQSRISCSSRTSGLRIFSCSAAAAMRCCSTAGGSDFSDPAGNHCRFQVVTRIVSPNAQRTFAQDSASTNAAIRHISDTVFPRPLGKPAQSCRDTTCNDYCGACCWRLLANE